MAKRPGADASPAYRVANISSLFSVCALALESVGEFRDDIRERLTLDIKHVLEMGAVLAEDLISDVERQESTGGQRNG